MRKEVIDNHLLIGVDKVVAVNLYQAGFDIVGITDDGFIDWILAPIYDEEIEDEVELGREEAIQEIMDYRKELFIASDIPIKFVEIKDNEQVVKTKYRVGDIVYAFMTDYSVSRSPGRVKELKIVGISVKQAYGTTSNMTVDSPSRETREEMYTNFEGRYNVENKILYYVVENKNYYKSKAIVIEEEYLFKNKNELKESI